MLHSVGGAPAAALNMDVQVAVSVARYREGRNFSWRSLAPPGTIKCSDRIGLEEL